MPIKCKVQFAEYQEHKLYHLNVYDAFQGPLTQSGINEAFATVERDAGTVSEALKSAGLKVEEVRAAVIELSGRYIKVYCCLLVECEYDPTDNRMLAGPINYDKVRDAVKTVGGKIK